MTETQFNPEGADNSSREVERVREIIFGPQIRDYDQRFDSLRRDIERLQIELAQLLEQINDQDLEQNKRTQALRREARQADEDLRAELRQAVQKLSFEKVDRFALGDLFVELGRHLKTGGSISGMLDDVLQQLDKNRDQGSARG